MNTIQPPQAPLDGPPAVTSAEADAMLDAALAGLAMGAFDIEVRDRIRSSPSEQAAIAAWCRRCWQAGVDVGREERSEA